MMGTKERAFAPVVAVSLEALVPPDHFYRHLDLRIPKKKSFAVSTDKFCRFERDQRLFGVEFYGKVLPCVAKVRKSFAKQRG